MNFIPSLKPISATGLGHNLGGVECNYQSSTYGGNPASAALKTGAAFFICANNLKIYKAMLKNYYYGLGTYVSPAIKVAQLNPRRVMCQSPFGKKGEAGAQGMWIEDGEDY